MIREGATMVNKPSPMTPDCKILTMLCGVCQSQVTFFNFVRGDQVTNTVRVQCLVCGKIGSRRPTPEGGPVDAPPERRRA